MSQDISSIPHPDRNRKRGDVREDGQIFWGLRYKKGILSSIWISHDELLRKKEKKKASNSKSYRKNAIQRRLNQSLYVLQNHDKHLKSCRDSYHKNKEKHKAKRDAYAEKWREENRPKARAMVADWAARNKDRLRENQKKRRANNPRLTVVDSVRRLIQRAFQKRYINKNTRTAEIVGCTWDELAAHIESKFTEGMTWENRSLWHVDHIIPLKIAATAEDIIRLNHWSNLQPLWIPDNLSKGAKMPHELLAKKAG